MNTEYLFSVRMSHVCMCHVCPKYCMGHTDAKKIICGLSELETELSPVFLFPEPGTLAQGDRGPDRPGLLVFLSKST